MFKKTLIVAAVALAMAAPAHALVQVNNWQLDAGATTYTGISNLALNQNSPSTVIQQTNASGQVYVGAEFTEYSTFYSAGYAGSPFGFFPNALDIAFTNGTGYVTKVVGNAVEYAFTGGLLSVSQGSNLLFNANVVGIGGTLNNSVAVNSTSGTSNILALILPTLVNQGMFLDAAGNSLDWFLNQPGLFIGATTTNSILNAATGTDAECGKWENCATLSINSFGYANLYRVPEPASLALVGLGLLGAGIARRRKVVAN